MCGINGLFGWHADAPPVSQTEIVRTRDAMRSRGPDAEGLWLDDDRRIGFGHRRLAIIDLTETGAQPMSIDKGRYWLTYNGEIYNFRALRAGLERDGVRFTGTSDSEVILQLYARHGADMVSQLRGMYAFAIWDTVKRELFLARDPLGIKPLYYHDDGRSFRFASQVKALVRSGGISPGVSPAGLTGYFLWGSVPEPWTIHEGVKALPAGSTLRVDAKGVATPHRFYSVADAYRNAEPPAGSDVRGAVIAALADSVGRHLIADVPVGCFLSAGIDSGAVLGLMRDAGAQDTQTITLGFDEFAGRENDEAALAGQVAAQYGMAHRIRRVGQQEFREDLPALFEAMDQPTVDAVNSWFVSKAASEMGLKVAMSGLGGDELFGGYPSFRDIPAWTRKLRFASQIAGAGALFRKTMRTLGSERWGLSPRFPGMVEFGGSFEGAYLLRRGLFMPWELGALMDPDMARDGLEQLGPGLGVRDALSPAPHSDFGKVAVLETTLYMRNQLLRDTDWASMAHSIEVRVPLVDPILLECVAGSADSDTPMRGKAWLAEAPSQPLPPAVVNRAKTGFTTPMTDWIEPLIDRSALPPFVADPATHWSRRWACHVAAQWGCAPPRAADRPGRRPSAEESDPIPDAAAIPAFSAPA